MGRTKQRAAGRQLEVTGTVVVPETLWTWERDLIVGRLRTALEQDAEGNAERQGGHDGA